MCRGCCCSSQDSSSCGNPPASGIVCIPYGSSLPSLSSNRSSSRAASLLFRFISHCQSSSNGALPAQQLKISLASSRLLYDPQIIYVQHSTEERPRFWKIFQMIKNPAQQLKSAPNPTFMIPAGRLCAEDEPGHGTE